MEVIRQSNNLDVKRWFMYQNRPSKSHQLPFDQAGPKNYSTKISSKCTRTDRNAIYLFNGILHRSEWPGFIFVLRQF